MEKENLQTAKSVVIGTASNELLDTMKTIGGGIINCSCYSIKAQLARQPAITKLYFYNHCKKYLCYMKRRKWTSLILDYAEDCNSHDVSLKDRYYFGKNQGQRWNKETLS